MAFQRELLLTDEQPELLRAVATPNQRQNPFASDLARANTNYTAYINNTVTRIDTPTQPLDASVTSVHDAFRAFVLNPQFSCVGAKSAFQRNNYRLGLYAELGSPEATAGLAHDLWRFAQEYSSLAHGFTTFVATFTDPTITDEAHFERLLWQQLQDLHNLDHQHHGWDLSVGSDPEQADFSFSFAERAFFVVGLHPGSCRMARRFAWPTLVFNAHEQFEQLRADGRYDRMQQVIRTRERTLQGSINANLSDFGERSDARQYSGRPVEAEWRCPFHAQSSPE